MKRVNLSILLLLGTAICFAQNVGIGTTTPEYNLHVLSPTVESSIGINATGTAPQALLNLSIDSRINGNSLALLKYRPGTLGTSAGILRNNLSVIAADAGAGALLLSTNQNSHMHFATNNVERMRITNTGHVGINMTNPFAWLEIANSDGNNSVNAVNSYTAGTAYAVQGWISSNQGSGLTGICTAGGFYSPYPIGNYGVLGLSSTGGNGVGAFSISGGTALNAQVMSGGGTAIYSAGNLQFTGIGESANKVLTSDASGNASWQNLPASAGTWGVNGTNIYNTNTGNVGINTTTPVALLTINNPTGAQAFQINHPGGFRITSIDASRQFYHEGNFWVHSAYGNIRLGYPDKGWFLATNNGGQDLQLFSHSTIDVSGSRVNRLYFDGITGNVGINTGNAAAVYGKLIVDRNADLNGALTGYFGSVTGLSSSTTDGSGVYGISYAPRTGAQGYAGVSGFNGSGSTDRFGVIGTSNGTTSGSVYSAGVGGYGDYGVLGNSQSATGAGVIAQSSTGKTALELNNGFIKVSGTNKSAFTVTAVTGGGGNTSGNSTFLSFTGMLSTDILIVTHNWQGSYIGALGVYWTGSAWGIFREDLGTMPNGEKFNVMVIKQ